jgi:hypothetical protein
MSIGRNIRNEGKGAIWLIYKKSSGESFGESVRIAV